MDFLLSRHYFVCYILKKYQYVTGWNADKYAFGFESCVFGLGYGIETALPVVDTAINLVASWNTAEVLVGFVKVDPPAKYRVICQCGRGVVSMPRYTQRKNIQSDLSLMCRVKQSFYLHSFVACSPIGRIMVRSFNCSKPYRGMSSGERLYTRDSCRTVPTIGITLARIDRTTGSWNEDG